LESQRKTDAPWREIVSLLGQPYVVLDTETTGLLAPEIVSVAVVDREGNPLLNEFVRPGKPIDPEASRITGIDAETVRDKPEFPAIEPRLRALLEGRRVVIYNAAYDLKALANTYARYGLSQPQFDPWCAMIWFAQIYGEWNASRGDFTWKPLSKAAEYFSVAQGAPHDALDDTMTLWRILQEAKRRSGQMQGMDRLFSE